jgi:hypothetical protein
MYSELAKAGENHSKRLQIVVGDHADVPPAFAQFVSLELSESNKLVPIPVHPDTK